MHKGRLKGITVIVVLISFFSFSGSYVRGMQVGSYHAKLAEVTSNRHVQPNWNAVDVESFLDTDGFRLVAQSAVAELWVAEDYHTVRLVHRQTGYVWGTIPLENARNLNKSWRSYGGSIVSIECYDKKNNEKRYGLLDNAVVQYKEVENGFAFDADYKELGIAFSGRVTLIQNRLTFELVENSLRETGEYRLKSLSFVPYFGSVFEDEVDGWFLLPDGPGALMRFQKSGSYIAGFDKKIYGPDLGIDQVGEAQSLNANRPDDYLVPSNQVLMPVYGIVHGIRQNGLLCVVEDGDLYASIVATPAGLGNTRYNSVMIRYEYRQKFSKSSNRRGAGNLTPQDEMNELTPKQSFYLLSGERADYDQMGVFYRDLLEETGVVTPSFSDDRMSLRLEVLGADVGQLALWKKWQVFTRINDLPGMFSELQDRGLFNLKIVLRNYSQGNIAGNALNASLGTTGELRALQEALAKDGHELVLHIDPLRANKDQINLRLQAAHTMGAKPIRLVRNNADATYPETFFYRSRITEEQIVKQLSRFPKYKIAVDQLSNRLFGDFTSGQEITRAETTKEFVGFVQEFSKQNDVALYSPNQIMWPYASSFYDLPLVSGQYLYETDTVPFLPIILKGSMALYAQPLNTGSFSQDRILRMIEYGIYPTFIVTKSASTKLVNTRLEDLYSTCFDDWKDYIADTFLYMQGALQPIEGQRITAHQAMDVGRVCVEYVSGIRILINYTDSVWESALGPVNPHDYLVVERGECR